MALSREHTRGFSIALVHVRDVDTVRVPRQHRAKEDAACAAHESSAERILSRLSCKHASYWPVPLQPCSSVSVRFAALHENSETDVGVHRTAGTATCRRPTGQLALRATCRRPQDSWHCVPPVGVRQDSWHCVPPVGLSVVPRGFTRSILGFRHGNAPHWLVPHGAFHRYTPSPMRSPSPAHSSATAAKSELSKASTRCTITHAVAHRVLIEYLLAPLAVYL
jgi:hypothetical protein